MMRSSKSRSMAVIVGVAVTSLTMAACGGGEGGGDGGTLALLVDNSEDTVAQAESLAAAFEEQNPDVNVEVETRPAGTEGDNLVKTRLSTGDMPDMFMYNSGSLFQALNPTETLEPLDDLPNMANVLDSFKPVVTGTDGHVYGVPAQAAMGGGILYNIPI